MILTIAINKGGTGKSTTAAVLAQAAEYRNKSVLVIDLEPQGNCSYALASDLRSGGSYELISGADPEQVIQHTAQNIDVIPASWDLTTLKTETGSARRLNKALIPIKGKYDYIIIDTPPTAGELLYNALQASTDLLIPMNADIYNIDSLYQITETARQFQQGSNPHLNILGVLFTLYESRTNLSKQITAEVIRSAEELNIDYLGYIRRGVAVAEAATFQQSLFKYAPKSKPAQDYLNLFEQIDNQ